MSDALPVSKNPAELKVSQQGGSSKISPQGDWTLHAVGDFETRLSDLVGTSQAKVELDLSGLGRLDTSGALVLVRLRARLEDSGKSVELSGVPPDKVLLLEQVKLNSKPAVPRPPRPHGVKVVLGKAGISVCFSLMQLRELVGFLGCVLVYIFRTIRHPKRLRLTALVANMEQVGFNAVPIVSLISFLIGVVLAYMGAQQLAKFGAQVYVVNLIEVAVLRELGILLTAIVVAGRSGSAFTAQIGSMKVNQEIDAMRTIGLDPMETLVLPRVLGLMIMLPLLGFISDMMGLFGGGLMSWINLGVDPRMFMARLRDGAYLWHLWVGLIKAPIFAAVISLIGCYEGFQVSGSAESVGRLTTRSVVESIFLVIIIDALFAIFFSAIGV